jgi:ABC-type polysaccharide/polyol phosphate transport system ATPase subunit
MLRLDNISILFEMRRSRLRRRMLSGRFVGGETVLYRGHPHVAALRDVSLEILPGSRVAVMGHNGAGKTTLLRTAAGVYMPFVGQVQREGRLSTLFSKAVSLSDYETGRENLELSCLLRGQPLSMVRSRIDEISEFTGLGQFLDEPLTSFSEGMKTRLGFAMAALADPDILLIDEILNATDIRFLESARKRIRALGNAQGIVMIASHAVDVLEAFCDQAIWLEHGRMIEYGPFDKVAKRLDTLADLSDDMAVADA